MAFFKFNNITISGIASAVPKYSFDKKDLYSSFGAQEVEAFVEKTGFKSVRHSLDLQTASDLGYEAANELLRKRKVDLDKIGFIIFISKTPDYRSPATAIVLQHRLMLSKDCLAYDVNLGSVGFTAGLQLGCSILNSINSQYGLVIIGDTNSKQINKKDISSMILGDASTSVLLEKKEGTMPISIKQFSKGDSYSNYIIPQGAFRTTKNRQSVELSSDPDVGEFNKLVFSQGEMNDFYSSKIPQCIMEYLSSTKKSFEDFDMLALQQSNLELLKEIAKNLDIELRELAINIKDFGDTSGSSIPLLLLNKENPQRILCCSFGEGLSWSVADFYLDKNALLPLIETDNYYEEGFVTHEM